MKIYISHSMSCIEEARELKIDLQKLGHTITSSWLESNCTEDPLDNPSLSHYFAMTDLKDVEIADLMVYFSEPRSYGKNIEFGYAVALGKPILLIGNAKSIFHFLDNVCRVASKEAAIGFIEHNASVIEWTAARCRKP